MVREKSPWFITTGLTQHQPRVTDRWDECRTPALSDSVSQNLSIWVGTDTQRWLIFHSHFWFFKVNITLSTDALTYVTAILPPGHHRHHNTEITTVFHVNPIHTPHFFKFSTLNVFLRLRFSTLTPKQDCNFGTLIRFVQPVLCPDKTQLKLIAVKRVTGYVTWCFLFKWSPGRVGCRISARGGRPMMNWYLNAIERCISNGASPSQGCAPASAPTPWTRAGSQTRGFVYSHS